jgi:hypothetical protein
MFQETKHTFESTFGRELSSILIDFMTLNEVFHKYALLNKNFSFIVDGLKSYSKVWREKFVQEF